MRWCSTILSLVLLVPSATAEDFSWRTEANGTSVSGGTQGQDEHYTETDRAYGGQSHNPDTDEHRRLVVEWGKVSMGNVDDRTLRER